MITGEAGRHRSSPVVFSPRHAAHNRQPQAAFWRPFRRLPELNRYARGTFGPRERGFEEDPETTNRGYVVVTRAIYLDQDDRLDWDSIRRDVHALRDPSRRHGLGVDTRACGLTWRWLTVAPITFLCC
jgi:hypothetical protein